MNQKTYNVGLLGFGMIGKVHAYGYLNLPLFYQPPPLQARITHVCTSRRETAEAGRALLGADQAVTDFRAVTEDPAVDIIHICTPNDRHKEALLSAMKHQKHIYCDKPLAATLAEAQEIEAALSAYRGTAQMTFHLRFYPATIRAKQLMEEGFPGQVLQFRACYLHAGSADPQAPLKWKLSAAHGGGVIADLASHVFDLVHHLLGDYAALSALSHMAYPERPGADDPSQRVRVDAEDSVLLLARMKSGAVGTIEATKLATGAEDEMRLEIHGSQGALCFNSMDPHHLEAYDRRTADRPSGGARGWTRIDSGQRYPAPAAAFPGPKFAIGWLRGHVGCLANFLQALADGKRADPGLEQGIYIQRIMDGAYRSAKEQRWVEVG